MLAVQESKAWQEAVQIRFHRLDSMVEDVRERIHEIGREALALRAMEGEIPEGMTSGLVPEMGFIWEGILMPLSYASGADITFHDSAEDGYRSHDITGGGSDGVEYGPNRFMSRRRYLETVGWARGIYNRNRRSLVKTPCRVCNAKEVEGHHTDYREPLKVVWLCKEHHMNEHRKPKGYQWLGDDSGLPG